MIQSTCLIIALEVSIDDHIVVVTIECYAAALQAWHDLKPPESHEQTDKSKCKPWPSTCANSVKTGIVNVKSIQIRCRVLRLAWVTSLISHVTIVVELFQHLLSHESWVDAELTLPAFTRADTRVPQTLGVISRELWRISARMRFTWSGRPWEAYALADTAHITLVTCAQHALINAQGMLHLLTQNSCKPAAII